MTAAFNNVQVPRLERNTFDLTHDFKFTGKAGYIYPSLVMPCIPGDTVNLAFDQMVRLQPLIAPVMGNMEVITEAFFVPNNTVFPQWDDFITQKNEWELPYIVSTGVRTSDEQKFLDYMGIPPAQASPNAVNCLAIAMAAYQSIYNFNYRDEHLIPEVDYILSPGNNTTNPDLLVLRKTAYKQDYFTTALPEAQLGNSVDLPLSEVYLDPSWTGTDTRDPRFHAKDGAGPFNDTLSTNTSGATRNTMGSDELAWDPDGTLKAGGTTVNSLRRALQVQVFLERLNRVGTRITEFIKGVWNEDIEDYRVQQPQFIGGAKDTFMISEVLNTAGIDGELPQGNMSGHGVAVGQGHINNYHCKDYGYIIAVTRVRPIASYSQGIPRHFLAQGVYDFPTPDMMHIGEMAIQKQELYAYNGGAFPTATFGYTPQYSDYRWIQSRIAGDLRTTLDFWTLSRFMGTAALNQDFIEVDPMDIDRIFAVQDGTDNMIFRVVNIIKANRKIPVYGTPRL